jgi:glycosyltransferase involved in cell wall biosynthesis
VQGLAARPQHEGSGLKILHLPFCFHPDPVGGTEVYVQNLACAQKLRGAAAVIAAPGTSDQQYQAAGLEVHRFSIGNRLSLRELYGEGDPKAAQGFLRILETTRPDVVHLHAFTSAVSLRVARAAKQAGFPVVFTYHTPTVSCQRGTLLRWGTTLCEGRLDVRLCTACFLHGQGLGRGLARLAAHIPPSAGRAIGNAKLSGGVWTALQMTDLVALRQQSLRDLIETVDHVVSLCSWTTDLLLLNGVAREKIMLCRHGLRLPESPAAAAPAPSREPQPPYRVAFLGRIHPIKGLEVLIRSIASDPELAVTLDIYGVTQGAADEAQRDKLRQLCDSRIRFCGPIPSEQSIERLRQYDVLAVPSQSFETGPLVVLEAFAAGIPVIGSGLGGIQELVRHETDGLLVEPASIPDWTAALRRLTREPGLLGRLRRGVRPPRTMETVAGDMLLLYSKLLSRTHQPDVLCSR